MRRPGIGGLRRRLTLETQARVADGGGGVSVTWTPVADLWAELRNPGGSETFIAEGLQGKVTHEIVIRKRMDVVPAMRFRQGTRVYIVEAVLGRDEPEPFLRILAEERNL
jgi:SPP1 family predicted phage head-tail adaptor